MDISFGRHIGLDTIVLPVEIGCDGKSEHIGYWLRNTPYEWSKRLAEVGRYRNASVVNRALGCLSSSRMTSFCFLRFTFDLR